MEHVKHFLSRFPNLKKRNLFVLCFLVFCFTGRPAYAVVENFYSTILHWVFGIDAEVAATNRRIQERQQERQREERQRVYSEDPERNRVLINHIAAYEWVRYLGDPRETIELRVTPTRVRPGESVRFEAIPSSETPDLGSRVGFTNRNFPGAPLRRRWFRNEYQGSLRLHVPGVDSFRIVTPYGYHSNSVSVVVAPDYRQLSWIYISRGFYSNGTPMPVSMIEGVTTSHIHVRARGGRRLTLLGFREDRFILSSPALGIQWTVDDESIARIVGESSDGILLRGLTLGRTTLRARYGSLEAEIAVYVNQRPSLPQFWNRPPGARRPRPVNPPDGFVGRVGERLRLEVTPFDSPRGYTFARSSWRVFMIDPATGRRRGTEMATLGGGDSEKAEWTPIGPGTFEWEVTYNYIGDYRMFAGQRRRETGQITSFPQRIVITGEHEITQRQVTAPALDRVVEMRLRDPFAIMEEMESEIVIFGYDINGNVVHESSGFEGIEFSILDGSIASVTDGVLSPKARGRTRITASYRGFEASANLVVYLNSERTFMPLPVSPANNAAFYLGDAIEFSAHAGILARMNSTVEWMVTHRETRQRYSAVTPDYTISWIPPKPGTYTFVMRLIHPPVSSVEVSPWSQPRTFVVADNGVGRITQDAATADAVGTFTAVPARVDVIAEAEFVILGVGEAYNTDTTGR